MVAEPLFLSSGGWEVQGHGAGRFNVWRGLSPGWLIAIFLHAHTVGCRELEQALVPFLRALNPILEGVTLTT